MKILVIAGHGAGDCGAVGNGFREADLTRELAGYTVSALNTIADTVLYDVERNCYRDIKNNENGAKELLESVDYVLELHLNSHANKTAQGVEVLCKRDSVFSRTLAEKVSNYGFYNRGVKLRKDLLNMNYCDTIGKPYALLECGFITNYHDVSLFKNSQQKIAQAIAQSFKVCYNLDEKKKNSELYRVQVGAFARKENAEKLKKQLLTKGFNCFITDKEDGFYRVQCGAFESESNAINYRNQIIDAGFDAFVKGF
jgi:N-acetylmuramoyl-L-alanine amidase|nr:MAG TPA: Cell wall hydrolase autolysin [Caudoviricetes sp.]